MQDKLLIPRRSVLVLGAAALAGMCVGCSSQSEDQSSSSNAASSVASEGTQTVEKAPVRDINGTHLRDNDELYTVYDDSGVVTMYLTVSRGNLAENTDHSWKDINNYSVYDYESMGVQRYKVNALLQVGDENGPAVGELGYGEKVPNATVQVRGQSSSKLGQKNYKISIKDNKGSWRGQRTIALNKHMSEGLRFRNKMAYDLIKGIDQMMGLRTQFVHLYVKDLTDSDSGLFEDYGLYTQVEQLNKTALKAHGVDSSGQLYKANILFEFYRYEDSIMLTTDPNYDKSKFEYYLEIKGDSDHSKLIEMLDKLNDATQSMDELFGKYFDIENIAYWMAFQILLGNTDTQSRNMYIYSPQNSDTWYIWDWDNDVMLFRTETEIVKGSSELGWERGISNYWASMLYRRCLQTQSFRDALDTAIEDLHSYFNEERINNMVTQYNEIVEQYIWNMPDVMYMPLTKAERSKVLDALSGEIEENYQQYSEGYKYPMPFFIGTPTVEDGVLHITWEASYDFDAENIYYTVDVASDYKFYNILHGEKDILFPETKMQLPNAGQYFVRVTATNESGYTQPAFDYYVADSTKYYGIKCFYVLADGSIVEESSEV